MVEGRDGTSTPARRQRDPAGSRNPAHLASIGLLATQHRVLSGHREQGMDYAMGFARGLERQTADDFVGMYVNQPHAGLRTGRTRGGTPVSWRGGVAKPACVPGPVEVEFAD